MPGVLGVLLFTLKPLTILKHAIAILRQRPSFELVGWLFPNSQNEPISHFTTISLNFCQLVFLC